jgi:hypothetical protein
VRPASTGPPSSEASGSTPARRAQTSRSTTDAVHGSTANGARRSDAFPQPRVYPRGRGRPPARPIACGMEALPSSLGAAVVRLTQDVSPWRARKGVNGSPACKGRTHGSTEPHPGVAGAHAGLTPKWGVPPVNHPLSAPAQTRLGPLHRSPGRLRAPGSHLARVPPATLRWLTRSVRLAGGLTRVPRLPGTRKTSMLAERARRPVQSSGEASTKRGV